jgi:pilus assembly protein CpaB
MQKQRIILIAGIVLAAVVVFLIKVYLDRERQNLEEEAARNAAQLQQSQTSVLVAKEDISKGTMMKPELFEPKIMPKDYVAPQAVTSVDRISGMVAIVPISKDEQITLTKLIFPKDVRTGGGLAEATPVGKRAITINADIMATLAGMVRPGNYVDILALIPVPGVDASGKAVNQAATVPLFQNVLILAVGQQLNAGTSSEEEAGRYAGGQQQSKPQGQQQASSLITIALTPQEANLAAFVQEQGKFRLILRSPADSQMQAISPASWEALFQHLAPADAAKKQENPSEFVEIYRGLKREKIPLSK